VRLVAIGHRRLQRRAGSRHRVRRHPAIPADPGVRTKSPYPCRHGVLMTTTIASLNPTPTPARPGSTPGPSDSGSTFAGILAVIGAAPAPTAQPEGHADGHGPGNPGVTAVTGTGAPA